MRIKELLKEKGCTQQELADMVGVSYQSIKQTLNASSVTTSTLEKIATALNVPMAICIIRRSSPTDKK